MVPKWNFKLGISFVHFQIHLWALSNLELYLLWEQQRMTSKKNTGL